MGLMTLEEMCEEVNLNVSAKVSGHERLARWVHFGYLNVCSYIKPPLEELKTQIAFPIVEADNTYATPTDIIGILNIRIGDRKLHKLKRPYTSDDFPGVPHSYMKRGPDIIIWPVPDDDYTDGVLEYLRTPPRMVLPTAVTIIGSMWDLGVVMLATHQGLLATGQDDRADKWLGRFLGYAGSRIKEDDISNDAPRFGINVAWTPEDIIDDNPAVLETDSEDP